MLASTTRTTRTTYTTQATCTLISITDEVNTHSQDTGETQPNLRSPELLTERQSGRLSTSSGKHLPGEQITDTRDFIMEEMQDYYNKKNIKELQRENFYDKLMALKKEQEEHIKLVESVYFKELRNNQKVSKPDLTKRPKSILKQSWSAEKV